MWFQRAASLIDANPDKSHWCKPASEIQIELVSVKLGMHLPPSLRDFCMRYGMGSFHGHEFFGVSESDPDGLHWPSLLNVNRLVSQSRLPKDCLIVSDEGDGAYYIIPNLIVDDPATFNTREPPVLLWWLNSLLSDAEEEAGSFGEFFYNMIALSL